MTVSCVDLLSILVFLELYMRKNKKAAKITKLTIARLIIFILCLTCRSSLVVSRFMTPLFMAQLTHWVNFPYFSLVVAST